jgi:hypothetical protein
MILKIKDKSKKIKVNLIVPLPGEAGVGYKIKKKHNQIKEA